MSTVDGSTAKGPLALRLPLDLRTEVAKLARRDERTLSAMLRLLVRLGLQAERERRASENVDARP